VTSPFSKNVSIRSRVVALVKMVLPSSTVLRLRQERSLRFLGVDVELEMLPIFSHGGAFIDVGTNIGTWSKRAAHAFARVYAFEPDRELSATLPKVLPSNVTVYPFALSDHEGTSELFTPVKGGAQESGRASLERSANSGLDTKAQVVELRTLDSLDLQNIDAIKIDVEGHEAAVLAGARRLIESQRPILICEIEERHHLGRSDEIIRGVCDQGYRCCYVSGGQLEDYRCGQIPSLQAKVPVNSNKKDQSYINNFIFIPAERGNQAGAIQAWLNKKRRITA
jgi:FkbM family methyltransferase